MEESLQYLPSYIIVAKDSEKQRERLMNQELREARRYFFNHTIPNRLKEAGATQKQQQQAIQLFLLRQNREGLINIDPNQLNHLAQYKKQIQELQNQLNQTQRQHLQRLRECIPLTHILRHKYCSLQVLRIQYKLTFQGTYRYSISAFAFFKVISENQTLVQATIKGVEISSFYQFIRQMTAIVNDEKQARQQQKWMDHSFSHKSLRLTINAQLLFDFTYSKGARDVIDCLLCFRQLFSQLSEMIIKVKLGLWSIIKEWGNPLQKLWRCLKAINKIDLQIEGDDLISAKCIALVRSMVFGGMTSLTSIAKLSFKKILFHPSIIPNYFLANEETLRTILQNNIITHLKLKHCCLFPLLPTLTKLQELQILGRNFRTQYNLLSQLSDNPSLRSVKFYGISQGLMVNGSLFIKLQTLIIDICNLTVVDDNLPQSQSSLKHLRINHSNITIRSKDYLCLLFSKLNNLTYLNLQNLYYGRQTIFSVPSPYLEQLHTNHTLTQLGLQKIDCMFPNLKVVTLKSCTIKKLDVWKSCKFKQLTELQINWFCLEEEQKQVIQFVRRSGIKFRHH